MRGRLCCVLSIITMLLCSRPAAADMTVDFGNRFTLLGQFNDGLCRISDGILTGYVDLTGNIVIEPKYADVYDPTEEPGISDMGSPVSFKNKNSILWGFRDSDGTERISPRFYAVREFSEGLAAVSFNNKWGFVDTTGEIVIPMIYNSAESFSQGLAIVDNVYAIDANSNRILRSYNVDGRKGVIYYSAEDRPDEQYLNETDNSIIYGLLGKDSQKEYGKKLTRAEFCILIIHMMARVESDPGNPEFYFDDTDDIDINNAFFMRIVDGIGDRLYAPHREITRQEAAKILFNYADYLSLETKSEKQKLSDRKQFADWAENGIDYAVSRNLMQPEEGAFFPLGNCTKQESIAYIYRLYSLYLNEK